MRIDENGISSVGWVLCSHYGKPLETRAQNLGSGYGTVRSEMEGVKRIVSVLESYNQAQHVKVYNDCKPAVKKMDDDAIATKAMEQTPSRSEPKYEICD